MESGRVGSSPSTMPESREWADPAEMLESANGEINSFENSVNIHNGAICFILYSFFRVGIIHVQYRRNRAV
jgi:hypothetical protein